MKPASLKISYEIFTGKQKPVRREAVSCVDMLGDIDRYRAYTGIFCRRLLYEDSYPMRLAYVDFNPYLANVENMMSS